MTHFQGGKLLDTWKKTCLPSTRLDVVAETLKISQRVAEECQEDFMIVHYNLAIAEPAKQIQQSKSAMFDKMSVCFGAFHIQLAYFVLLGYIKNESRGLIFWQIQKFGLLGLSGNHFNRCKRLFFFSAQAFRVLHFRAFPKECGDKPPALHSLFHELYEQPSPRTYAESWKNGCLWFVHEVIWTKDRSNKVWEPLKNSCTLNEM